jgi:endonuclease-8
MPEGPSIVILKEAVKKFRKKKVLEVTGNTKTDKERLLNRQVIDFKSWGKHFLICFKGFTVRIHFLLFGSYRIDEHRELAPRLSLRFTNGVLNFYSCSVKFLEGDIDKLYDWKADVMSKKWDPNLAAKKLKQNPDELVCDALLDQEIFAGVGNIIKNEILFRIKVQPQSIVSKLPSVKTKKLIEEARTYSFDFYEWKKLFVLRKHWKVHAKKTCPDCGRKLVLKYPGKRKRRAFYCSNCQLLYK